MKDSVSGGDYIEEEDPTSFVSKKTGRGPLTENWRQEHAAAMRENPKQAKKVIMCAYKVCRAEFKYWGMQSKIERFIHDVGTYMGVWVGCEGEGGVAGFMYFKEKPHLGSYYVMNLLHELFGLGVSYERSYNHTIINCACISLYTGLRKTMVRAHRQAWTWQDEYHGLTIEDIRRLEKETAIALAKKMGGGGNGVQGDDKEKQDKQVWYYIQYIQVIDVWVGP